MKVAEQSGVSDSLTIDYLAGAERDARRFAGAYTGTAGTLAAHTIRSIKEVRRMTATIQTLEEQNRTLRNAVAERLAKQEEADAEERPDAIPADWILRGQRELEEQKDQPEPEVFRLRGDSLLQADDDDPPAARLLLDAASAVRQRRATYGPPKDHFQITVALVNAAFGTSFKPEDWATIMQLDKIARSRGPGYTADNDVDGAGYAACRHEIVSQRP